MLTVESLTSEIPGINTRTVKSMRSMGIKTVHDLLLYFPKRHVDFSSFAKINQIHAGEVITIVGTVKSIQKRFSFKSRKTLAEAIISDETGSILATWFNQGYIASMYKPGDKIVLSGKVTQYKKLQFTNPVHEILREENIHTGRLVPMYKLPETLYSRTFRSHIKTVLHLAEQIEDNIPQFIQDNVGLLSLPDSLTQIHFPENQELVDKAKERFIFEEVLIEQLAVGIHKERLQNQPAYEIKPNIDLVKETLKTLPFELTLGQKAALWEILKDMEIKHPMNRLLEGDVGSGKTLVAFLSMLETAVYGKKAALLAPTEILAKQHYESLQKFLSKLKRKKLKNFLFTRNFSYTDGKVSPKAKTLEAIEKSTGALIIGTHALLFAEGMNKNLALLVIDEQHRFGVNQRSLLTKAPDKESPSPHLLSLSATPIPRTLALSLYGDLDISRLTELPKGRQPISTFVVPERKRKDSYTFIKKEIVNGRQAFIITPLIEDSEKLQAKAVTTEYKRLQTKVFPTFKLAVLHGGMKGTDKDSIMQSFVDNITNILVATSVVEVGVDIPNASVMVIENADRFGLAQLHQLRGRIGRGEHKSYCLLFTDTQNPESIKRLSEFARIQNGFELAELDLEQRGFGSLFGLQQSGFDFKFSEYLTLKTLKSAREQAQNLLPEKELKKNNNLLYKKAHKLVDNLHLE